MKQNYPKNTKPHYVILTPFPTKYKDIWQKWKTLFLSMDKNWHFPLNRLITTLTLVYAATDTVSAATRYKGG